MPVLIESSDATIVLSADRAVSTEVAANRSGVVPVLLLDETKKLHAGKDEIELHPLSSDERLVAFIGDDDNFAAGIFPNQKIVKVQVDFSVITPSVAWQSVDAVILDRNIDETPLKNIIDDGITIAIKSIDRPDQTWPWKKRGDYWILQPRPAGPVSALAGEAAYLPTQSWQPCRPRAAAAGRPCLNPDRFARHLADADPISLVDFFSVRGRFDLRRRDRIVAAKSTKTTKQRR